MGSNYEKAKVFYGDEDLSKDGAHEKDRVYPTAFITARCFAEQTTVPHAKELYEIFFRKMGFVKGDKDREPASIDTPHFMELRYLSSEKVIREAVEKENVEQIVELASGFTPHSVSLLTQEPKIQKYIENDFPVNSKIKQEVINEFVAGIPVEFIPGNVLDEKTWEKIEKELNDSSVAIFCEGLMMYLSREAQMTLFNNVKKVLGKRGGFFMHEDILKYHPELRENPRFARITAALKSVSASSALDESFTQEEVQKFYEEQDFTVERIDEDSPLSIETYPEATRENATELSQAGFKMWKLSLAK